MTDSGTLRPDVPMDWILECRNPVLTPVFLGLTALGDESFFMVLLPLGTWLLDRATFRRLTLMLMATAMINGAIKGWAMVPRPMVEPLVEAHGWSMPSGHAQMAAVLWPWLASAANRAWAGWLAAALVVGVACSRVYLGVHTPLDVSVGVVLGLLLLIVGKVLVARPLSVWENRSVSGRLLILATAVVLWTLFVPDGGDGASRAAGGLLLGYGAGAELARARLPDVPPRGWQAVLAVLGGMAVLLALRAVSKPLGDALPLTPDVVGALRYGLLGFWTSFAAPWCFVRARRGLADRAT